MVFIQKSYEKGNHKAKMNKYNFVERNISEQLNFADELNINNTSIALGFWSVLKGAPCLLERSLIKGVISC
ncbi:hypothetical protein [Saliterribacillus persicus]|uniref:Uncharacterized protein n=1 Tax=Saliterribacillus persicus TaxID=930114 RepID=A0A368Y0N7_9BACI|nr:hypothetical protein [Saliterribacillus persicus]RCW73259.1 hypothetical protein DFR57_104257 [Saliterribacillus persicus]